MSTVLTFSDGLDDILGGAVPPKAPPAFVDNPQTGESALGAPEAPGDGLGLPGPIPAVLTEGELAALFGVSGVLIRQRARDGDFVKVARGRYDVRASILRYTARLRAGSRVIAGDPDLKAEKLRIARAQAEALERSNRAKAGETLAARDVERAWSGILRDVRAAMLAVPSRVGATLPHLTAHDVAAIEAEIRSALEGLTDGN